MQPFGTETYELTLGSARQQASRALDTGSLKEFERSSPVADLKRRLRVRLVTRSRSATFPTCPLVLDVAA